MTGGRISASYITKEQVVSMRWLCLIGWMVVLGVFPWLHWWNPGAKPELQFQHLSIQTCVIMTFVSFPLGWFFGYKLLWAPLFVGRTIVQKPQA
jgi:hypothetical protein